MFNTYSNPPPHRRSRGTNTRTQPATRVDPLRFFPQEIVASIFALACEPHSKLQDSEPWRRECHPLCLGRVSRAWRHAAWGTSELWSTIILSLGRVSSLTRTGTLLTEWIERAKEHPLDIWLQLPWLSPTYDTSRALYEILMTLKRCCGRWRMLVLRLTPAFYEMFRCKELRSFACPFSKGLCLPRLEYLAFQSQGLDRLVPDLGLDFSDAPQLKEFYIGNTNVMDDAVLPTGLQVPRDSIRRLVYHNCQLQVSALLNVFPVLEELEYREHAEFLAEQNHIVIHEQLKTISVGLSCDDDPPLASCILPSLTSIRIESSFVALYSVMLREVFLNVQVPMTHLHLESIGFEEDDLITALDLTPSLTHLVIRDTHYPTHVNDENATALSTLFFHQLNPTHGRCFLRRLEEFEYQGALNVDDISFLEPFVLRSQFRKTNSGHEGEFAKMRRIVIRSSQGPGLTDCKLRIVGHHDRHFMWEVVMMIEKSKTLVLVDEHGGQWY